MKINGKTVSTPEAEILVIPRGDDKLILKIAPVFVKDFIKQFPEPASEITVTKPDGTTEKKPNPNYVQEHRQWVLDQTDWMYITSLSQTEGLEWDTVDLNDRSTFKNWQTDLSSVLLQGELLKIFEKVNQVMSLDGDKITKATEDFLREQAEGA